MTLQDHRELQFYSSTLCSYTTTASKYYLLWQEGVCPTLVSVYRQMLPLHFLRKTSQLQLYQYLKTIPHYDTLVGASLKRLPITVVVSTVTHWQWALRIDTTAARLGAFTCLHQPHGSLLKEPVRLRNVYTCTGWLPWTYWRSSVRATWKTACCRRYTHVLKSANTYAVVVLLSTQRTRTPCVHQPLFCQKYTRPGRGEKRRVGAVEIMNAEERDGERLGFCFLATLTRLWRAIRILV